MAKNGHEVTVVTCVPNHPMGKVYPGYKNKHCQHEVIDGIHVIRLWTYITANEGFVKRTLNYLSYMFAVLVYIPFLPKHDVFVSTSPQFFCGLAGYFVKLFRRKPWIIEIRDLWPESIVAVGAIHNKFIIRVLEYLEILVYRKSDHIIPVTDAFKAYMLNKSVPDAKITVIKNGVDLNFYAAGQTDKTDEYGQMLVDSFVAAYVGTHGMAHHLETILEAAEILIDRKDIFFLMVGHGAEKESLVKLKESKKLGNVIMVDQQAREKMPLLWALSDVSLVLLKKSDLFKTVIPSKIFESMAMKKPIVLGVEGEVKGMIEEGKSGITIEPENAEALAAAVLRLADNRLEYNEYAENGYQYVAAFYDRKILAQRFEDILQRLVSKKR
ncbi:Glycosyl transferase, group 1 [hydrothermal vent metagenome]|uniref:Glycosyl transferase, group 1 n=1 Tax=hydrothermal vent metagenome TaxID=652676 RepID=A0A3B0WWH7_9ZZZZ